MYQQSVDPLGGSVAASAVAGLLPLATLFVLLGVFRVRAHVAALVALVLALAVALLVWGMPATPALSGAVEGAVYGLFPILWILVNALWIYRLTEISGWFSVLRRSFATVSADQRVQAILIAFCFGSLIEGIAGFGTPVAISAVMLIAVGLPPLRAAVAALVANTAPVAFGSLAVPITTLSGVSGIPVEDLGAVAGRQTPLLALVVPLILAFIVDGRRGLRATWPVALVAGVVFAVVQFVFANYVSVEVTDIAAGVATLLAVIAFMRVWSPREVVEGEAVEAALADEDDAAAASRTPVERERARTGEGGALLAFAPYLLIIVIFGVAQLPPVADLLDRTALEFAWPGVEVMTPGGDPATANEFALDTLGASGTLLLLAGVLTAALYRLSPRRVLGAYGANLGELRFTIVTVVAVLSLSYVMNLSGQTGAIGAIAAEAGDAYAFLSPVVGWIGVAITGSDTSSNSLFGALQVATAKEVGLDPVLMAASNSSGGVLGKMLSPQNLAVAAAAIGMQGSEGTILRRVLGYSLAMLLVFSAIVYLQSTAVLGWMLP